MEEYDEKLKIQKIEKLEKRIKFDKIKKFILSALGISESVATIGTIVDAVQKKETSNIFVGAVAGFIAALLFYNVYKTSTDQTKLEKELKLLKG